jgi:signal transduction histidine kinase
VANKLLALPEDVACVMRMLQVDGEYRATPVLVRSISNGTPIQLTTSACNAIGEALEASRILTVPIARHDEIIGRCFVCDPRQRAGSSDVDLLVQVFHQVMPIIDNIRLVDRLASEAAESERRRIARDIHDGVIQSYVGIQLALHAVEQRSGVGVDVTSDIRLLNQSIDKEITDARQLISRLEQSSGPTNALCESLRRFSGKFSAATGVAVDLQISPEVTVSDRLAAEVFGVIEEGLSNIRRHTTARQATVRIAPSDASLLIQIDNPSPLTDVRPFTPKSIVTRAKALGGRTTVRTDIPRKTSVAVQIPL